MAITTVERELKPLTVLITLSQANLDRPDAIAVGPPCFAATYR